LFSLWILQ
jgi:hypothetical protein